jgi:hypothetical protein
MKTAMQEYVEYLEGIQKRDNLPRWIITTARNYFETEKQQIIDAYNNGQQIPPFEYAEDYYNKTFKK